MWAHAVITRPIGPKEPYVKKLHLNTRPSPAPGTRVWAHTDTRAATRAGPASPAAQARPAAHLGARRPHPRRMVARRRPLAASAVGALLLERRLQLGESFELGGRVALAQLLEEHPAGGRSRGGGGQHSRRAADSSWAGLTALPRRGMSRPAQPTADRSDGPDGLLTAPPSAAANPPPPQT